MHLDQSYKLMWRSIELGPLSISEIRQQLTKGELHSMYLIQVDGNWLPLRDFLETVPIAAPKKEIHTQNTSSPVETPQTRSTPPPLPGSANLVQTAQTQGRQSIFNQQSKLSKNVIPHSTPVPQSQSRLFWVGVGSAIAVILLFGGLLWSFAGRNSNSEAISPTNDILEISPDIMSKYAGTGTGFFITTNGYLVTNFHVVKNVSIVKVKTSTGLKTAKIICTDPDNDLALLKIEGSYEALPVSPGKNVALGNTVATVGFPTVGLMGFSPKLAKGEITSLAGIQDDQRYFQISVPVQPGNSGGALINERGNVVGIVSAKLDVTTMLQNSGSLPENVNYAVKSSLLIELLKTVPDAFSKLHKESSSDRKFEDVVTVLKNSSALVLVK